LICGITFPQDGEGETFPDNELNIQVQNAPNRTITFEFIPLGANWTISSGCNIYLFNDENTYISTLEIGELGYVDCWYNGYEYRFYNEGNYTSISDCADSGAGLKPLRNGFYRMNIYDNDLLKTFVYFDWRDTGFPRNVCRSCSGPNDMTIRYDGDDEELWFWNTNSIRYQNQNPDEVLIIGQIITWAELNCTPRATTYLENFWENALVATNDRNDHPRLVGGPHPTLQSSINNYKIYYNYHLTGQPPGTFYLLETVNSDVFEYTDLTVEIGNDYRSKSYYVTGVYDDLWETVYETSPTNTVTVVLSVPHKRSESNYNSGHNFVYSLEQNYPNPFNPTTTIIYSIKREEFVSLKVFDILGNDIATLVNEIKPAGNHEVEFIAKDIPSGIYFYTLSAGNFTSTKKLILLK
jgi:hypothetical protein